LQAGVPAGFYRPGGRWRRASPLKESGEMPGLSAISSIVMKQSDLQF